LGPSSLPVVVAQLTKDIQAEQLLCWSGMTDTEYSTTSSSNEEDHKFKQPLCTVLYQKISQKDEILLNRLYSFSGNFTMYLVNHNTVTLYTLV